MNGLLPRIDFFVEQVEAAVRDEHVFDGGGMHEQITHGPLGVVANISAWNYPYFVGCNVIVPALLTGNAVLYKPSEFAAQTGLHIARLLHSAGVPPNVMQTLVGAGEVGSALLDARIDGLFFTGSHATGVRIAQALAPRLVKVQLELGGKDPSYVRADADPKVAAESLADGAMYNTGQSCCSVERIYVHESLHDAFVDHFLATVAGFKVGDPMHADTYIGAITRAPQLAVLDGQVADARAKGATLHCGGHRLPGPGNWYAPDRVHQGEPHDGADARGELRPDHRHPEGERRRPGRDADERHPIRPDGRRLHARRAPGARVAGPRQRRQRVLELLRPRQSAPALVGAWRLGPGPDAVHAWHPDLHAPEGLAPAAAMTRAGADMIKLALFDLDHTLLDGDSDMLWCDFLIAHGVLDDADFAARNEQMARDYRAGSVSTKAFCEFYVSTLAVRPRLEWEPLRREFLTRVIAPRIGASAAGPGAATRGRRRSGGLDDGHQPFHHRADRDPSRHRTPDRHRVRDRCPGQLHRAHAGHAEHA